MLNAAEIKELHPLSYEKLQAWAVDSLKKYFQLMTKESGEEYDLPPVEAVDMSTMFLASPRNLYEFFDSNGVVVTPYFNKLMNLSNWKVAIDGTVQEGEWASRLFAEEAAFRQGFVILETQLNQQQ